MASADSPTPLSAGVSPGRDLFFPFAPLGSTECHQWLLGFVFASTLAPDILPHCPFVFLRSNVCLPPFRAASLRRRPGGSATVGTTSPRREPFIPPDQTPAGHTSAGFPACGFAELSSSAMVLAVANWGLESPQHPQTGMSALRRIARRHRPVARATQKRIAGHPLHSMARDWGSG